MTATLSPSPAAPAPTAPPPHPGRWPVRVALVGLLAATATLYLWEAPTLAEFQQLVGDGRVHWFVGGSGPGGTASGGSDQARRIAERVAATSTPTTVDGTVLHDLTTAR